MPPPHEENGREVERARSDKMVDTPDPLASVVETRAERCKASALSKPMELRKKADIAVRSKPMSDAYGITKVQICQL